MSHDPYYWTRDLKRGRKEAFWSNGEIQLRVHGPMSHVNRVMQLVLAVYNEPSVPGPPPKIVAALPEMHPDQTDILTELAALEEGGDGGD